MDRRTTALILMLVSVLTFIIGIQLVGLVEATANGEIALTDDSYGHWVSEPQTYGIGSNVDLEFVITCPEASEVIFKIWCSETDEVFIWRTGERPPYTLPYEVLDMCAPGRNEVQATLAWQGYPIGWMSYFYCEFKLPDNEGER